MKVNFITITTFVGGAGPEEGGGAEAAGAGELPRPDRSGGWQGRGGGQGNIQSEIFVSSRRKAQNFRRKSPLRYPSFGCSVCVEKSAAEDASVVRVRGEFCREERVDRSDHTDSVAVEAGRGNVEL